MGCEASSTAATGAVFHPEVPKQADHPEPRPVASSGKLPAITTNPDASSTVVQQQAPQPPKTNEAATISPSKAV